ncbi:MAG: helix-hairpin-helix domain-containing protein [Acidobacteriota bacterium]
MQSIARALLAAALVTLPAMAQLPDGPGKEETTRLCSQCHEVERAISLRQDTAGWQETVNKMSSLGMTGKDADMRAVVNYLAKNFPADAIPKLNVNKAIAIEFESALSIRRSQAAAIIEYRTQHGDFKSLDDLKKVPGLDPAKLDAKKDRLTF